MIYVSRDQNGKVCSVVDAAHVYGAECRHDWVSFQQVQRVAADVTEYTGFRYAAVDNGSGCHPRFDVVLVPQPGDDVSMNFNGDSYPCGKVKSVSASLKLITTTDGSKFYRLGTTGKWLSGGWALVKGHHSTLNPSF